MLKFHGVKVMLSTILQKNKILFMAFRFFNTDFISLDVTLLLSFKQQKAGKVYDILFSFT